jgi:hypothetical protein
MPRRGATFDENIPLLGGASARGAGVGYALLGKPTPAAVATGVATAATLPWRGFQRSLHATSAFQCLARISDRSWS